MTVNRYSEAKGVLLCTSTTHPLSPAPGDRIYETDTGKELTYQGPTDTWTLPWGLPWGTIAETTKTTGQTLITALVDLTGLSVTFTAVANRKYRITGYVNGGQVTSAGFQGINIATGASGAGTQLATDEVAVIAAGFADHFIIAPLQSPVAGSTSYHLRAFSSAASMSALATATQPNIITVDDVGPNGAPS